LFLLLKVENWHQILKCELAAFTIQWKVRDKRNPVGDKTISRTIGGQ